MVQSRDRIISAATLFQSRPCCAFPRIRRRRGAPMVRKLREQLNTSNVKVRSSQSSICSGSQRAAAQNDKASLMSINVHL